MEMYDAHKGGAVVTTVATWRKVKKAGKGPAVEQIEEGCLLIEKMC